MSCALQSEDADSDMSDAEGRGSVSEDESSMRPAARSKRLPGKCDSPDTQDSSEAVSHGGSKAGRGALPCQDDKKGRGVGRAKCVWAAMLGGDCYGSLAWQRQDPLRSSCQAKQGRLGGHCRGNPAWQQQAGRHAQPALHLPVWFRQILHMWCLEAAGGRQSPW